MPGGLKMGVVRQMSTNWVLSYFARPLSGWSLGFGCLLADSYGQDTAPFTPVHRCAGYAGCGHQPKGIQS